jgi:chemotaxis protein MotA
MNITLLVGMIAAFGLVVFGIFSGGGDMMWFVDVPSIIIVLGGTFAALIATTPISQLKNVPKYIIIALLKGNRYKPAEIIDQISEYGMVARSSGLLALEEHANNQEDPFFQEALLLIVDAIDADKIRERLTIELDNLEARHLQGAAFFERGAALGPAMGMLGTLIGLVNMLNQMDFDSGEGAAKLAASMGVALITTFYGSLLANVLFTPIANQLKEIHSSEMLCKEIIIEGILSIQAGENPKFIKEKLLSFLSDREKDSLTDSGGE